MSVLKTSVGRKLAMAFTGQFLLLFLLGHVADNATVWVGQLIRFPGVDTALGPEMKSTGKVMGIDPDFGLAFAKSQSGAG